MLDRRMGVERHGRLLVRGRGRLRAGLIGGGRRFAARGGGRTHDADDREPAPHGVSSSCFFHAARRLRASSGDSPFTSRRSTSARKGGVPGAKSPSGCASGAGGGGWWATGSAAS